MVSGWLPVVVFHSVCDRQPSPNPYNLRISAQRLDRTLRFFSGSGYSFIDIDCAFEAMMAGDRPRRAVCVTFDDGYADFLSHALPVLRKYQCPATLFLVSGRIGQTNLWDAGRTLPELRLLGEDEVRGLAEDPLISFGAHSATHPWLTQVTPAERDREIANSREALEALLQREVRFFAYPHHDEDADVRRRVEAAGFAGAFTGEGPVDGAFALPRLNLRRVDPLSLRFWCGGFGQQLIERAAPLLRMRRRLAERRLA